MSTRPEAVRVKPSLNSALSSTRAANFICRGRASKAGQSSAFGMRNCIRPSRRAILACAPLATQAGWSKGIGTAFLEYENELNRVIADRPIVVLCTYPFSACKAGDMFEVIRAHQVALAKRHKEWAV